MGLCKTQINLSEKDKSSRRTWDWAKLGNFFSNSDKFVPNSDKLNPNSDKFVSNSNKFVPNSDKFV